MDILVKEEISMQQQGQNQMQQNQQPVFQTPPKVVTGKDLNYIKDMLSWNLLGMKKAHFNAAQCQDQEIKALLEKACKMHEGHYTRIMGHISGQQSAMNQPQTGKQN